jgi:hypothetical protein
MLLLEYFSDKNMIFHFLNAGVNLLDLIQSQIQTEHSNELTKNRSEESYHWCIDRLLAPAPEKDPG